MRSFRVVAAVAAVLCTTAATVRAAPPQATVTAGGVAVPALFSSGEEFCADHATFGDAGWPPVGLDRLVPATAGQSVRIAFSGPATLRSAEVTGLAAPIVRAPASSMSSDGAAWRVTLPTTFDPAGKALVFTVDWADDACHGDQIYAVGLGAPAEVGHVRLGRDGRARVTLLAHAAITVVATLRGHRTTAALAPGQRRTLALPAGRRARLRVVITTADGARMVVTRRLRAHER